MSAADHADEHDEHQVFHQAPWVYFATYGVCLGFLALVMFAKGKFFASSAIIWLTLMSIPFQVFLAKKEWLYTGGVLGAAIGGFYGLQFLLG